jgi:chaperonin GroEL (HSP60 family)
MRESTSARYAPLRSVFRTHADQWGFFFQGQISNILEEDVVQPLLVSTSAIELSTETVTLLLKIDDYVQAR